MEHSRAVIQSGWYAAHEGGGRLLDALVQAGAPLMCRSYGGGDTIYCGDDAEKALYVLTRGVARLFVSYPAHVGSKQATFLLLGAGDIFGYPLFAGNRPGRVPAEAFTDCEVVKIPRAFVERAISRRPEVALEVAALLERRLVEYEELVGCLLPRHTAVRLARVLWILARKFGEKVGGGGVVIGLKLTRADLAEMTASTRESVTAAVTRLRRNGILTMGAGRVVLLKPDALSEIGRR